MQEICALRLSYVLKFKKNMHDKPSRGAHGGPLRMIHEDSLTSGSEAASTGAGAGCDCAVGVAASSDLGGIPMAVLVGT